MLKIVHKTVKKTLHPNLLYLCRQQVGPLNTNPENTKIKHILSSLTHPRAGIAPQNFKKRTIYAYPNWEGGIYGSTTLEPNQGEL